MAWRSFLLCLVVLNATISTARGQVAQGWSPALVPPASTEPIGLAPLETGPTAVKGKWNPTLYGFVELDMIHDSTESFSSACPGYNLIARPGTFAGNNGRTIFDARNTRFGFKLAAPEFSGMKATAVIETDFAGSQLPLNYGTSADGVSEQTTYSSPIVRLRHAAIKIETRYVDVLAGEYWQLFGWAPIFLPLTVQVQTVPGVPLGRDPQLRLSHTFKTLQVSAELAVAAARPPGRDGEYPDGQGGARLLINRWRGVSAVGATGATFFELPASIGISGAYRRLQVAEFTATPDTRNQIDGRGLSLDAFLPIVPSRLHKGGNGVNLTGNFTIGRGIADLYAPGIMGGAGFPALLNPNGTPSPNPWPQDIDNGIVTYDREGVLHAIAWKTFLVGGQYYVPPSGRVWMAANYGCASSANVASYNLTPASVVTQYTMWDAVAYINIVGPVTVAGEFAQERQTYGDGIVATNNRVIVTFFYSYW